MSVRACTRMEMPTKSQEIVQKLICKQFAVTTHAVLTVASTVSLHSNIASTFYCASPRAVASSASPQAIYPFRGLARFRYCEWLDETTGPSTTRRDTATPILGDVSVKGKASGRHG